MKNNKFLLFLVMIVVLVLSLSLIACNNNPDNSDPEEDDPTPVTPTVSVNEYLSRINRNIGLEEEFINSEEKYSVESEVEIIIGETLNYTVLYKAVYDGKENENSKFNDSQKNKYFIKIWDNNKHKTRLQAYYNGEDLFLTFTPENTKDINNYVVNGFNSYLLYELFTVFCNYLDIGDLVTGPIMKDQIFKPGSVVATLMAPTDFKQVSTGEKDFSITINRIDASAVEGRVNSYIETSTQDISTKYDALTMHYLGFKLSALTGLKFGSIILENVIFSMNANGVVETTANVDGNLQDGNKYKVSAKYSINKDNKEIKDGQNFVEKNEFENINLKQGTYDGIVYLPTVRETEYYVTLDYDLDIENNQNNEFTFRIYDQSKTIATSKYESISEFIGIYYSNEILYCNFEGLFNIIGDELSLSALNLPKVYFQNVNFTSILRQIYTYLYRAIPLLFEDSAKNNISTNSKFREQFYASLNSDLNDTTNPIISLEITEELIKAFLDTDRSLAVIIGEQLGLEEAFIAKTIGTSFFSQTKVILTYEFGTKFFELDVYQDTDLFARSRFRKIEYTGVVIPTTANETYYAEFVTQNDYTLAFDITFTPYDKENVDLSRFLGTFLGDVSGKNTIFNIKPEQNIVLKGKITERQINSFEFTAEDRILDFGVYVKNNTTAEERLLAHAATSSDNVNELLVTLNMDVGDYVLSEGDTIKYKIPTESVINCLKELGGEGSIYNIESATALVILLTNSLNKKSKVYSQDGYYCASLKIDEEGNELDGDIIDPGYKLFGIKGCNYIAKFKGEFSTIDLTKYRPVDYTNVVLEKKYVDGVSYQSIYSNGSAWDKNVIAYINEKEINLYVEYTEESTKIVSGKSEYNPTGELFGQTITYTLNILELNGTNAIKNISLPTIDETPIIILDPALTKELPTSISVIYDNDDISTENCEIEGFIESNIQNVGFNKQLLNRDTTNAPKYTLTIGKNSIAQIKFDVYVAVMGREVLTDKEDGDYYGEIPIIAEYKLDPYYFANRKYFDSGYDYIKELINLENTTINFNNEYYIYDANGAIIEEKDENDNVKIRTYDEEGYNYFYLKNLDINIDFDYTLITYNGGHIYATSKYGDIDFAIRIVVQSKQYQHILINDEQYDEYTIDCLIKETYDIPVQTDANNTVKIVINDGQNGGEYEEKIVKVNKPTDITDDYFYRNYIITTLNWANTSLMKQNVKLDGTYSLFGDDGNKTKSEITGYEQIEGLANNFKQTINLIVNQPSRNINITDLREQYLDVYHSYSGEYSVTNPQKAAVFVNNAKFRATDEARAPYAINPYNSDISLPNRIFLYVAKRPISPEALNVSMDEENWEYKEYDISWRTTDELGNELEILEKKGDNYVLKSPTVQRRLLNVYGSVGDAESVWVTMLVLNMDSQIKSIELYQNNDLYNSAALDETTQVVRWAESKTINIDPYVNYASSLPNRYNAILGSGERISEDSITYYYIDNDIKYPIIRSGEFSARTYDRLYFKNGLYAFPLEGGIFNLTILINGESDLVSNEVSIAVNVNRTNLKALVDSEETFISHYIDVINAEKYNEGSVYSIDSKTPSGGYLNINVYEAFSETLASRLEEIRNADGESLVGVLFDEINNYYVRTASFNMNELIDVINALRRNVYSREYTLTGTIDAYNSRQMTIKIKFTLIAQEAKALVFNTANNAINNGIYSIKSDIDKNRELLLEGELDKVNENGFTEKENYNKYYNTTETYNDLDFDYVIYFEVEKSFGLYIDNGTNYYVSPFTYFSHILSKYNFRLKSESIKEVQNSISLTNEEIDRFNKTFLGLIDDTIDNVNGYTYSFLKLNKLSLGSAEDNVLLIFKVRTSSLNINGSTGNVIYVDVFDEDLNQAYLTGYSLPQKAELTYIIDATRETYKVNYKTGNWTPVERTAADLGIEVGNQVNTIDYQHIYVTGSGNTAYDFTYKLPDINTNFTLGIIFTKKNFKSIKYNAESLSKIYEINEGEIVITNPYVFFNLREDGKGYTIRRENIPNIIKPIETDDFIVGNVPEYKIEWMFGQNNGNGFKLFESGEDFNFDSSILTNKYDKILIAIYEFDSYCVSENGTAINVDRQKIELYISTVEMNFRAFNNRVGSLTVIAQETEGENEIFNTIVIDPYEYKENNESGIFTLPKEIMIQFIEKSGSAISNNVFQNVRYKEISDNLQVENTGYISVINFTENGIERMGDKFKINVRVLIPGYDGNYGGANTKTIIITIKILQRVITDKKLANFVYDEYGNYVYENNEIKKYYPQATLKEIDEEDTINEDLVPIHYIDPYNNTTYRLPEMVNLRLNDGDEITYKISEWKYQDKEFSTNKNEGVFYHTKVSDGANGYYYNYQENDNNQRVYRLKASIRIGDSEQSFDVLVIVINRALKINTVLGENYKTTWDYSDPIAALLRDIPSNLVEDMFVSYDKYLRKIDIDNLTTITISENNLFGQNGQNKATIPSLLWESEYDTNKDGILDKSFNELIETGFSGQIQGNVYTNSKSLMNLINDQTRIIEEGFDVYIKAVVWDLLYSEKGTFNTNISDKIEEQNIILKKNQIYLTYSELRKTLSAVNLNTLDNEIVTVKLNELNAYLPESQQYNLDIEEDLIEVLYEAFTELEEEYNNWVNSGSRTTQKTQRIVIFDEYWNRFIDELNQVSAISNVVNTNQRLKAGCIDRLNQELGSIIRERYNNQKKQIIRYINSAIFSAILNNSSDFEYEYITSLVNSIAGTSDELTKNNLGLEALKANYTDEISLGIKGEETTADITIPKIELVGMVNDGGSLINTKITMNFSKFDLYSLNNTFNFMFNVTYKNVLENDIKDAIENTEDEKIDENIEEIIQIYVENEISQALQNCLPTEVDPVTGERVYVESIRNYVESIAYSRIKSLFSDETFTYPTNTLQNFSALYNQLYLYYKNESVDPIIKIINERITQEANKLRSYDDIIEKFENLNINNIDSVLEDVKEALVTIYEININDQQNNKEIYDILHAEKLPEEIIIDVSKYLFKNEEHIVIFDSLKEEIEDNLGYTMEIAMASPNYGALQNILEEYRSSHGLIAAQDGNVAKDYEAASYIFNLAYFNSGYKYILDNLFTFIDDFINYYVTDANDLESYDALKRFCSSEGEVAYIVYAFTNSNASYLNVLNKEAITFYDLLLEYIYSEKDPYDYLLENCDKFYLDDVDINTIKDAVEIEDDDKINYIVQQNAQLIPDKAFFIEKYKRMIVVESFKEFKIAGNKLDTTIDKFKENSKRGITKVVGKEIIKLIENMNTFASYNSTLLKGDDTYPRESANNGDSKESRIMARYLKYIKGNNDTREEYIKQLTNNISSEYIINHYTEIINHMLVAVANSDSGSAVTTNRYINAVIYGQKIGNNKYMSLSDYIDDLLRPSSLIEYNYNRANKEAKNLIEQYNLEENNENIEKIRQNYVENYAIQTYIYFHENEATDIEQTIIENIIEKITSSQINGSIMRYVLSSIIDNRFSKDDVRTIYNNLNDRADFTRIEQLNNTYNYIFLKNIMEDIKEEITNEYENSSWYKDPTNLKSIYQVMINGIFDKIEGFGEININIASEEELSIVGKIASRYYYDTVYNTSGGFNDSLSKVITNEKINISIITKQNILNNESYNDSFKEIAKQTLTMDSESEKAFYQAAFNKLSTMLIDKRISQFEKIIDQSLKEIILSDIYKQLTLFDSDINEVKTKLYNIITSNVFYEQNNLDDLIIAIKEEYNRDPESISIGKFRNIISIINTNWWEGNYIWWGRKGIGVLDDNEKELINQIYLQYYYVYSDETLARITLIGEIIHLLEDISNYKENEMEKDLLYNETNNEEQQSNRVITINEANIIKQQADVLNGIIERRIDANKTLLNAYVQNLMFNKAKEYTNIIKRTDEQEIVLNTYDEYINRIRKILLTSGAINDNINKIKDETGEFEDNTEDVLKIRYAYDYILFNLNYTAFNLTETDKRYQQVGNDNNSEQYTELLNFYNREQAYIIGSNDLTLSVKESITDLKWIPLNWYRINTDGSIRSNMKEVFDYLKSESVNLVVPFYSEDTNKIDETIKDRHIIYFDRTEWQNQIKNNETISGTSQNRNIYLTNKEKTNKGNYQGGGIYYTNSFVVDNVDFTLVDITEIKLDFGQGIDNLNYLVIDALNPILPKEAIGYGVIGENETQYELGKVTIGAYSEAFYDLIYKGVKYETPTEIEAYMVTCYTKSGEARNVQVKVEYLNREIDKIYSEKEGYTLNESVKDSGELNETYPLFNETRNTNVIRIDPLNKETNSESNFVLPEVIYIQLSDGSLFRFTDVRWDTKVNFALIGTNEKYIDLNILGYTYYDSENNITRYVNFNYQTNVVEIQNVTNESTETLRFSLPQGTNKLNWNIKLYIVDRTVQRITYLPNGEQQQRELGRLDTNLNLINASNSTYRVNPYYPEYPKNISIEFKSYSTDKSGQTTMQISNPAFVLSETNALININQQNLLQGDPNRNLEFNTKVNVSNFIVDVRFKAMDVKLPTIENEENLIDGGVLYLVTGQGTASEQINSYYKTLYYDFGEEGESNWQRVPIYFDPTLLSGMSTQSQRTYENVHATLGATSAGVLAVNAKFTIKVVQIKALASLEGTDTGFNKYVEYSYLTVPLESNNTMKISNGTPNYIGRNFFAYVQNAYGEEEVVNFIGSYEPEKISSAKFNLLNSTVALPISYYNTTKSSKIGFSEEGGDLVNLEYVMEIKTYNKSLVAEIEFETDDTGKIWKNASTPDEYGFIWPLGRAITSENLPRLISKSSEGTYEIYPYWDLSNLNVNKANTNISGREDGVEITAWYIGENDLSWNSLIVKVYINKIDIHEDILNSIDCRNGQITKEYDGQYVVIDIDMDKFDVIREDGTKEPIEITDNNFIIEYSSDGINWEENQYPLDAGTYYVRVKIDDYNIECVNPYEYESLIKIIIEKKEIDLNNLIIENENNRRVTFTYNGKNQEITISGGVPKIHVDNWFENETKQEMFNRYRRITTSDEEAKARVYEEVYQGVSEVVQSKIVSWYNSFPSTMSDILKKANVFDLYFTEELDIEEVVFTITYTKEGQTIDSLVNCGSYIAFINFDENLEIDGIKVNKNYTIDSNAISGGKSVNISIVKDSTIVYGFVNNEIEYNGKEQNPRITGLNEREEDTIPSGVTIYYTYSSTTGEDVFTVTYKNGQYSSTSTKLGIKNVGQYNCRLRIEGGDNYIDSDGEIEGTISIVKSKVFIDISDQTIEYLTTVPMIENLIKVYSKDYINGSANKLRGDDLLSQIGSIVYEDTGITQNSAIGNYYVFIKGLRAEGQTEGQVFTNVDFEALMINNPYTGKQSRKLKLKTGTDPGYIDFINTTSESHKLIKQLFDNYDIYIAYITSDGEDNTSAATITITTKAAIAGQEVVYNVDSQERLNEVLDRINNNVDSEPSIAIYIEALSNNRYYDVINLNTDKNITVVGYYDKVNTTEIATKVKGFVIKKGNVNIKIISILDYNRYGVKVNSTAGNVIIEDCNMTTINKAGTYGVYIEDNYAKTIAIKNSTLTNFEVAVRITNGRLEATDSTFGANITDIETGANIENVLITGNTFNGSATSLNLWGYQRISITGNTFEYLATAIEIPLVINNDIRLLNKYINVSTDIKIKE